MTRARTLPLAGAGPLLSSKRLLSLNLSLKVTRTQFSDLLRMLEANRLKDLHFTVEEKKPMDRGRSIVGAFRSKGNKVTLDTRGLAYRLT
jgi:hypothetical protein